MKICRLNRVFEIYNGEEVVLSAGSEAVGSEAERCRQRYLDPIPSDNLRIESETTPVRRQSGKIVTETVC